ncbi:MAG: glycine--tRNA ligase subunit beta [Acidobacteria bacterium]|nr:glycine--tRNA ligase subunit beta [Acidobacteriota bacterium]
MDRELLIEIGVEELPASWLPPLTEQLGATLRTALTDHRLTVTESIEVHGTPRRLAACVPSLVDRQDDRDETLTGPPVSAGRGPDGKPTPAGLGFAKKHGVEFSALTQVETSKGTYLAVEKNVRGRATVDVLPDVLTQLLRTLPFPRQMHWDAELHDGKGELLFGRPIRWLLFLFGGRVVPYTISRTQLSAGVRVQDVSSGAVTFGHRFLATSGRAGRAIKVRGFDEYKKKLAENFVFLSRLERRDRIVRELDGHARRVGGRLMLHQSTQTENLLEEVPDLVEYPSVVAGTFAPEFLKLPAEVLTTTLVHHQHFFPIIGNDEKLMPAFLAVTNTQSNNDKGIAINAERVVTARLRDARFFWDADRKIALDGRLGRLETLTFHKKLGSYRAKAERVARLARWVVADVFGQSEEMAAQAERAGRLAKADLATDMVREFTELQGVMGGVYAREAGEPEAVWKAIYYHYLPIAVESTAAPTPDALGGGRVTWAAVALADKLDTIAGLFQAGERPTGSRDPFGLRRAAHGVIRVLVDLEALTGLTVRPSLTALISRAVRGYGATPETDGRVMADQVTPGHVMEDAAWADLSAFLTERLSYVLETRGADRRNVRAVLKARGDRPVADVVANLEALPEFSASEPFRQLATAFKRVRNIARELADEDFAREEAIGPSLGSLLTEPSELALLAELDKRTAVIVQAVTAGTGYREAYLEASRFEPAVAQFFTDVFVMADDLVLRQARLRLMKRLEHLILQLGDISEIVAAE